MTEEFLPPLYLRNSMLQTILNSMGSGYSTTRALIAAEKEMILDLGQAKLQGFMSRQGGGSKGMVMILHGWEGSTRSAYVLRTSGFLYEAGYDVFRLNFRDHGETHHLNCGLFIGDSLNELYDAVKIVSRIAGEAPLHLAGFSMGANFVVRSAARFLADPIPNLKRALAINPVIDPLKSTQLIDQSLLIRVYLLRKWKASLALKQNLFPDQYNFDDILRMKTCMEMSEAMITRYFSYRDAADYFSRFTLTPEVFARVGMPLCIITSQDDPIIPVRDIQSVIMNANTTLMMQRYGGHCGYIMDLSMRPWYLNKMIEFFA